MGVGLQRNVYMRPVEALAVSSPLAPAKLPGLAHQLGTVAVADLLELLDVQEPYLNLDALEIGPDTAWGRASRESLMHSEIASPMSFGEMCRHVANVGAVACASANPVRTPHMYLALKSTYKMSIAPGA